MRRSGQVNLALLIVIALLFGLIGGLLGTLVARQSPLGQPDNGATAVTVPVSQSAGQWGELQQAVKAAAANATPAVVNVHVEREARPQPFGPFMFEFGQGGPEKGQGSGFFFDDKGHVLTNAHVVEGMDKIEVSLSNGKSYTAKVVGLDHESDVAVLQVDLKGEKQAYLQAGNDDGIEAGTFVLAIGNPLGYENSVTLGIVSALHRQAVRVEDRVYRDLIQTDTAINPGNSGGPLITLDGKVIGINTVIASPSGGSIGIGFAIPMSQVQKLLNDLLTIGHIERPALGVLIDDVTPQAKEYLGYPKDEGAVIGAVVPGGPAAKAGLLAGDIITEIDHKPIKKAEDVIDLIKGYKPGNEVSMQLFSKGAFKYVKVKLVDKSKLPNATTGG